MLELLKSIQPYAIAGIFVIIYLAEHLIPERRDSIDLMHDAKNIGIGLFNLIIVGLGGFYLQKLLAFMEVSGFGLFYYLPNWLALILGILFADVIMYWWHRVNHLIPFLWYFHKVHHEDTKLNTSSSLRFHFGELALSYVFKVPFFLLLGISVKVLLIYGVLLALVVTFHHSNIKIGKNTDFILRKFVVSPNMHRIHHSEIKQETDSNYSSLLPYWDKIFGSYIKETSHQIKFGIK